MPASEGGNAPQAQPPERRGDDSAGPALLQCQGGTRFQCVEDDACELAFEAAECFASALPLALLALEVSASGWVEARACVIAIRCRAQLSWRLPPRSSGGAGACRSWLRAVRCRRGGQAARLS